MDKKQAKIIAHAWKDPRYKERLFKNPRAALKELDIDIPESIQIKVIEEKPNTLTLVLPSQGARMKEMSEQELEKVVGGAKWTECTTPIWAR